METDGGIIGSIVTANAILLKHQVIIRYIYWLNKHLSFKISLLTDVYLE